MNSFLILHFIEVLVDSLLVFGNESSVLEQFDSAILKRVSSLRPIDGHEHLFLSKPVDHLNSRCHRICVFRLSEHSGRIVLLVFLCFEHHANELTVLQLSCYLLMLYFSHVPLDHLETI